MLLKDHDFTETFFGEHIVFQLKFWTKKLHCYLSHRLKLAMKTQQKVRRDQFSISDQVNKINVKNFTASRKFILKANHILYKPELYVQLQVLNEPNTYTKNMAGALVHTHTHTHNHANRQAYIHGDTVT